MTALIDCEKFRKRLEGKTIDYDIELQEPETNFFSDLYDLNDREDIEEEKRKFNQAFELKLKLDLAKQRSKPNLGIQTENIHT